MSYSGNYGGQITALGGAGGGGGFVTGTSPIVVTGVGPYAVSLSYDNTRFAVPAGVLRPQLANNTALQGVDSGATLRDLLKIDGSNVVTLGNTAAGNAAVQSAGYVAVRTGGATERFRFGADAGLVIGSGVVTSALGVEGIGLTNPNIAGGLSGGVYYRNAANSAWIRALAGLTNNGLQIGLDTGPVLIRSTVQTGGYHAFEIAASENWRMGADGGFVVGSGVVTTALGAPGIGLANTLALYSRNGAGSAWLPLLSVTAGNIAQIGDAALAAFTLTAGSTSRSAISVAGFVNTFDTNGGIVLSSNASTAASQGAAALCFPNQSASATYANAGVWFRNAANGAWLPALGAAAANDILLGGTTTDNAYVGGAKPQTRRVSGSYTLDASGHDEVLEWNTSGGAGTFTLPTPSAAYASRVVLIRDDGNAGTNNITTSVSGGSTINGSATQVLSTNYGTQSFQCNTAGTAWRMLV